MPQAAPFAVMGIGLNGQSLSTGNLSYPTITPTQPYSNLQLHDSSGSYASPTSRTWSAIPLVTPIRAEKYGGGGAPTAEYPNNIGGETLDVSMANQMTFLSGGLYRFLTHCVGQGGAPYAVIGAGGSGNAYQSLLNEVQVAAGLGLGYGVVFNALRHGEADAGGQPGVYLKDLLRYQSISQTAIQALTGQTRRIPLLVTQQQSNPAAPPSLAAANYGGLDQLYACRLRPRDLKMVGPCYAYPFATDPTNGPEHFTAIGEQMCGEKHGEVGYRLLQGLDWLCFAPIVATIASNVITIPFQTPLGLGLQFSSSFSAPHQSGTYSSWAAGLGFEAWTGGYFGTSVGITSVAITGGGTAVQVTCASAPDTIAYAMTPDRTSLATGGFPNGRCGLLCDLDPFVGQYSGQAMPNFCPCFVIPVT